MGTIIGDIKGDPSERMESLGPSNSDKLRLALNFRANTSVAPDLVPSIMASSETPELQGYETKTEDPDDGS